MHSETSETSMGLLDFARTRIGPRRLILRGLGLKLPRSEVESRIFGLKLARLWLGEVEAV